MKTSLFLIGSVAIITAAAAPTASGALPSLSKHPWFGFFAVFYNNDYSFALSTSGQAKITPTNKVKNPVSSKMAIQVAFVVEEMQPNGRAVVKKIDPATLESKSPATAKLDQISFRGKVTGEASFEAHLAAAKGGIEIGGRLLDPGTLTKNPVRFGIQVTFPSLYTYTKKTEKRDLKNFEKKLEDDRYTLTWSDGKRLKISGNEKVDAESDKVSGPGITELKMDLAAYQGKTFLFTTSGHAKMTMSNKGEDLLHEGCSVLWYPDPAADPDGKARLRILVK